MTDTPNWDDTLEERLRVVGEQQDKERAYVLRSIPKQLELIARLIAVLERDLINDNRESARIELQGAMREMKAHLAWLAAVRAGQDPRDGE